MKLGTSDVQAACKSEPPGSTHPSVLYPASLGFGIVWILLEPVLILLIRLIPHRFLIPVLIMVISARNVYIKNTLLPL